MAAQGHEQPCRWPYAKVCHWVESRHDLLKNGRSGRCFGRISNRDTTLFRTDLRGSRDRGILRREYSGEKSQT